MEINSDELNHVFNKCINEQLINIISIFVKEKI